MPIAVGGAAGLHRVGGPGTQATPGRAAGWSTEGAPPSTMGRGAGCVAPRPGSRFQSAIAPFRSPPFSTSNTSISGVTRDSGGAAIGSCRVELFQTGGDIPTLSTTSDGSGNFRFDNPGSGPFYIVAYKAGSPDVAGTTVNTLTAA